MPKRPNFRISSSVKISGTSAKVQTTVSNGKTIKVTAHTARIK